MNKSSEDAFAGKPRGSAKKGADPADNTYIGTAGEQFSRSSGTTPLGGESQDQDREPKQEE